MRAKLLLVLILLIGLNGCATTVLHPIDKVDILSVREGETLLAPKDGWFLSDMYLNEVVKAKVKK